MPLRPRPVVKDDKDIRVIDNGIIRIDTVYVPLPEPLPRPRPIVRHEEEKKDRRNERQEQNRRKGKPSELAFEYFGTPGRVRTLDRDALVHCNDGDAGEAWMALWNAGADLVTADMIDLRDERELCDWAFRGAVEAMSKAMLGDGMLGTLLYGYVMSHAGYKTRFVRDDEGKMYVACATDMYMYNVANVWSDGTIYYVPDSKVRDKKMSVSMCDTGLPGEQALSMRIDAVQKLALKPSAERIVRIDYLNAKGETVKTRVNENIVAFYDTYPKVSGALDQSPWQVIAEIPTDTYLTEQLYPQLRKLIKGMSQEDAVNTLMGVCQSFPYGYDDEVWGYDYPLTVEQSWYHPKSDCEDHAIHLSRLVRDLLGLEKRYFSCETID